MSTIRPILSKFDKKYNIWFIYKTKFAEDVENMLLMTAAVIITNTTDIYFINMFLFC